MVLFSSAKIKLDEAYHKCAVSDHLEIVCDRDPLAFPYIDEIFLNGAKIDRRYLTYEEITNGGTLSLILKNK